MAARVMLQIYVIKISQKKKIKGRMGITEVLDSKHGLSLTIRREHYTLYMGQEKATAA